MISLVTATACSYTPGVKYLGVSKPVATPDYGAIAQVAALSGHNLDEEWVSRFEAQAPREKKAKFGLGYGKSAIPDYGAFAMAAAMSGLAVAATGDSSILGMIDPLHPVQAAQDVMGSDRVAAMKEAMATAKSATPNYSAIAAASVASA